MKNGRSLPTQCLALARTWRDRASRLAVAGVGALALAGLGGAALAQQIPPPASYSPTDANGVNLFSGSFSYTSPSISIGPEGQGLSYSATFDTGANAWRHSVWGGMAEEPFVGPARPYPTFTATILGETAVFAYLGGEYVPVEGNGTLTKSGTIFTYTTLDGSVAVFGGPTTLSPFVANRGLISTLTRPNGEQLTWTYAASSEIQSVTSNRGYQLHFQYTTENSTPVLKVTALNNAVDACAPTAASCSFSRTWPSLTFGQTGTFSSTTERRVTDALGHTTRLLFPGGTFSGIRRPTLSSGQNISVTWTSAPPYKIATVSDGAGTWTYNYTVPLDPYVEQIYTTTVRDPLLRFTTVEMVSVENFDLPGNPYRTIRVIGVTNDLGQETTYGYGTNWNLALITYPEGNSDQYQHTYRGDLYRHTRQPKPGSSATATVVEATYPSFPNLCTNPVLCGRPVALTDARLNVTDFTYDAAGNLLTETGPAPTPGAPRPQTRYVWEQRYAWYKQNGSSAITQAPTPIWVMVEQSQCMTGATC